MKWNRWNLVSRLNLIPFITNELGIELDGGSNLVQSSSTTDLKPEVLIIQPPWQKQKQLRGKEKIRIQERGLIPVPFLIFFFFLHTHIRHNGQTVEFRSSQTRRRRFFRRKTAQEAHSQRFQSRNELIFLFFLTI